MQVDVVSNVQGGVKIGNRGVKHNLIGLISALAVLSVFAGCDREVILSGERFPVRVDLDASMPVKGRPAPVAPLDRVKNRAEPISIPSVVANADWTHRGGNVRHAGPNGVLSAIPQLVWTANIGQGNSRKNRISAAPVVAGGRVFTMDSNAHVQATSVYGAVIWASDLTANFDRDGGISGGGIAAADGVIYAATGYGELVALRAEDGAVIWRQRLDSPVTGMPAVEDGVVYVVSRDGSGWAVKADTGRVMWTVAGPVGMIGMVGSAGPTVSDTLVLFPFAGGGLLAALKKSGLHAWQTSIAGQRVGRAYAGVTDVTGDAVVHGQRMFVGTASGRMASLDMSNGMRVWTANEGALNPPLVVGGSVFVVNDENRLVRLDAATGEEIWAVDMPYFLKDKAKNRKAIAPMFGPVLAGGRLVVAGGDGQLRLFSPVDGTLVGGAEIPSGAASAPALAGGMLYIVSASGQLHAFR
ncbi:MAG: PQQ-binding-like beta-propeller repeat protein [Rhodobacteraceae bacterium]|nr:PQQ-binding-like beta-propeller repeat protein [Paracoccaceae bacterium]